MAAAGLEVRPSVIIQYGNSIGEQESELASIQALMSGVHLTADSFGKLPEAGELYNAYTQHASVVQDVMNKLPGQIENVAKGLLVTGQTYNELEEGMAEGISNLFGVPSTAGYSYSAPSSGGGQLVTGSATVVSDAQSSYSWIFSPETSLPSLGIQNLAPATNGWLGNYIQEAVDFVLTHCPILSELLDKVTGNYAQLKSAAADWHTAGTRTLAVVQTMKTSASDLPSNWAGSASDSFGTFMGNVTEALEELATVMGQTQKIIENAAAEANFAEQTISMILSEVIEWVAGNIALDFLTAGLATGISALASSGFIARKIEEAVAAERKFASALKALEKIIQSLSKIGEADKGYKALKEAEGLEKIGKFLQTGKNFSKGLELGTLANMRFLGEGKLAAGAVKVFDVAGRGLEDGKVAEITEMGAKGMGLRIGTNTVKSMLGGLTGLPAGPGAKGLVQDLIGGTISDLGKNGQGAATAVGAGPSVPSAPPANRIAALLNGPDDDSSSKEK